MRTLIAGGGTAGHLTPAIAVASRLLREDSAAEVLVVGRRGGMEERIVPAAGLPLATLTVRGVDVSRPLMTLRALSRTPLNVLEAGRLLRRHRPDVVVGAGGYVCVPVVIAARRQRIPVVLLEQNAIPGRAVRLLSHVASAVAASFAETAAHLPGVRVVHTGNPVRAEVLAALPAPLPDAPRHLLVMGGSQGALRINTALAGSLGDLLEAHPELNVAHSAGTRQVEEAGGARDRLPMALRERYTVAAFFDDVATRIARSDLVLMRAGGSSLAEVSVLGRPMLLVPYPHAGDHQRHNAAPYARVGAAVVIPDAELSAARLRDEVAAVVGDRSRWRRMADASRRTGLPDADARVAALIAEVAA